MAHIFRALALSAGHLTEAAAAELNRLLARPRSTEPGTPVAGWTTTGRAWWLRVDDSLDGEDLTPSLASCVGFARAHGASYILFEVDADPIPELPFYGDQRVRPPDFAPAA